MKLILFEESFVFFEKYKRFNFYVFELYTRLYFVCLVFFSLFSLFWEFRDEITVFLLMFQKNFFSNHTFLVSNEFFEIFYYNILLSSGLAFIGVLVCCCFHFFFFINPGLYRHESQFVKKFIYYEIILILGTPFLLGLIYIPIFWTLIVFLQYSSNEIGFSHIIELKSNVFIKTIFQLYVINIFIGQCFLSLIVLITIKNQCLILIFKYRKFLYFCLLLISTCITPPDIYSQLFCAIILIALNELIFFFNILVIKLKKFQILN